MRDVIGDLADAFYVVMWVYLTQRYARGWRLEWRAPNRADALTKPPDGPAQ